jgi:deoxyribose-phosphate aldolase
MSINPTATTTIREYINKLKRMGAMEISFAQLGKINLGSNPAGTYSGSASVKSSDFQNLASAGADRIGSSPEFMIEVPAEVANLIDHTLLKPDVTKDKIIKLCQEAKQYNFASVCVNPGWVKLSAELLQDCPVKVCTVIGFPLGATTSAVKAAETREAVQNGADEIDMVINIGALKTGDNDLVYNDIKAVVDAAQGKVVKVIIETTLLTDEEKVTACKLSKAAGADYVKTSTGFAGGGATIADIALMRSIVGPDIGVKASGGVNDFRQAKNMLEVGATRIGASAGIAIISGGKGTGAY